MQNLEENLKDSFAEAEVEGGFLEVEGGDPEFNWSPKKERLLQGRLRGPGGDLRGWRSEKDVGRGGGEPTTEMLKNTLAKKSPIHISKTYFDRRGKLARVGRGMGNPGLPSLRHPIPGTIYLPLP